MCQAGEDRPPWDRPRSSVAASSHASCPAISGSAWFQRRHQHTCPMRSANTDNIPASATPGTKDKRFLSPEGDLGEKSWEPREVGGKEEKRGGFLELPWRPHPCTKDTRGTTAHFNICSNITKDRRSGLSKQELPSSRSISLSPTNMESAGRKPFHPRPRSYPPNIPH